MLAADPAVARPAGRSRVAGALVNLTDVAALRRRWLLADVEGGFRLGGGPAERLVALTEATALQLQSAPAAVRSAGATPSLCGYRGRREPLASLFLWMDVCEARNAVTLSCLLADGMSQAAASFGGRPHLSLRLSLQAVVAVGPALPS